MTDRHRRVGRRDRVVERQTEEDPVPTESEAEKPPRRHTKERKEHSRQHKKDRENRHRRERVEEKEVEEETEPVEIERESEAPQEEPSVQEVSENEQQQQEEDEEDEVKPTSVEEEDEDEVPKKNKKSPPIVYSNVIGKASERDLNILKNIAKGAPRFQHVYGTRDYADIALVDKDKKEHYLSAIMLSSDVPRSLIADIMECREERDNLCVVRLPISNVATEILVKYAYQIPIGPIVSSLDLATKKQVISEFDKIQALPIISELYRDRELISIGDPKSIATWLTTCATSNVSLAGQLPEITPQLLRYLDSTVVAVICKVMPPDDEIGVKLAWCCAREAEPDGKSKEELINESQVLLQGIPPTAKLPSLDKLTNMLSETVNPVVYRFILNKTLNTKLPLKPGPVNVPPVDKKGGDKVATPNKKGKSPGKVVPRQ